jgi:hypothetical protein
VRGVTDTAKAIYDAYVAKDRGAAERLLANNFRFTSTISIGFDGDSNQSRSETAADLIQPSVSLTASRLTLHRPFCLPDSAKPATHGALRAVGGTYVNHCLYLGDRVNWIVFG